MCTVPDLTVWESIMLEHLTMHAHVHAHIWQFRMNNIILGFLNFSGPGVWRIIIRLPSGFWFWKALRSQDLFAKHTESVLSKTSKIRSLITDLQKNYHQDSTAMKLLVFILYSSIIIDHNFLTNMAASNCIFKMIPYARIPCLHCGVAHPFAYLRAVETLNNDLKVLDTEYNQLSDHLAKGERDDHSKEQLCLHFDVDVDVSALLHLNIIWWYWPLVKNWSADRMKHISIWYWW